MEISLQMIPCAIYAKTVNAFYVNWKLPISNRFETSRHSFSTGSRLVLNLLPPCLQVMSKWHGIFFIASRVEWMGCFVIIFGFNDVDDVSSAFSFEVVNPVTHSGCKYIANCAWTDSRIEVGVLAVRCVCVCASKTVWANAERQIKWLTNVKCITKTTHWRSRAEARLYIQWNWWIYFWILRKWWQTEAWPKQTKKKLFLDSFAEIRSEIEIMLFRTAGVRSRASTKKTIFCLQFYSSK